MTYQHITSSEETRGAADQLEVVKGRFPKVVIHYYWSFVILSFFFFLCQHHLRRAHFDNAAFSQAWIPGPITLSYYPLYIVVSWLVKSLLWQKIPGTLARLRETGSLSEAKFLAFMQNFEARLNHPMSNALGVGLSLLIVWYYRFLVEDMKTMTDLFLLIYMCFSVAIMLIDILLAYASGVVIWKAGVTTWEFWELGRTENLKIRPGYPDGCGGLAPIGRLFFPYRMYLLS
jgi:hypothetical protein